MTIQGDKEYKCIRICTTYVEKGRTVRSLANVYRCRKSTSGNCLNKYAQDNVPYELFKQVRERAKQNMLEVYELGCSENRLSDAHGSMD